MCQNIKKGAPSVVDFMEQFRTDKEAMDFIIEHIYPCGEIVCPRCGCTLTVNYGKKSHQYSCGHCRRVITPMAGTMFERTRQSYREWLYMIYEMFVSRRSISSHALARKMNKDLQTIWRFRQRVQAAMGNYDLEPFGDIVEVDELYSFGSNHGFFCRDDEQSNVEKCPILGIFDKKRHKVYSYPAIRNEKGQYLTSKQLKEFIDCTCKKGSIIVSDEWRGYNFLDKPENGYQHRVVNHQDGIFIADDGFSTNGIEGYWGIIKRMYYSTHTYLSKKHFRLYLMEADFRFNHQDWRDAISDILRQGVFFPQAIDIRRMGRFGNRTYDLKKYRMILPYCFERVELEDITPEDILTCEEPVYGILKEEYKTKYQRRCGQNSYPDDWKEFGLGEDVPYQYKDYRKNIVNTIDDIKEMIKDATYYSEVNNYTRIERKTPVQTKSEAYRAANRNYKLKQKYRDLPDLIKVQIKKEYPNVLNISTKNETTKVRRRMTDLLRWYNKNQEFLKA